MTPAQARRATVLIVDIDQALRESLRTLLEDDQYDVFEAADGAAMFDLLRADACRLIVLLDHSPPVFDGIGLLRQVARDRRLRRRHAFILMTTNRLSSRLATLRFLATLQVPLIRKPFDIEMLEEAVGRAAIALRITPR